MEDWQINWVDYYEVLEIKFDSSQKEIRKSYLNLIKKYHPDVNDSEEAKEKSALINTAYDVLGDKDKRKEYDKAYIAKQNGEEIPNDDINEDKIYKHYTDKEKELAEKLKIQSEIAEELNKIEIIFEKRNEILYTVIQNSETFDNNEYQSLIIDFTSIVNEYSNTLTELLEKAEKYNLVNEKAALIEAIDMLSQMINELPDSPKQAYDDYYEKQYEKYIMDELEKEIESANQIKEELESILKLSYKKEINKFEYPQYIESAKLRSKQVLCRINKLYKLQLMIYKNPNEIPNKSNSLEACGELDALTRIAPDDYENACIIGKIICATDTSKIQAEMHDLEIKIEFLMKHSSDIDLVEPVLEESKKIVANLERMVMVLEYSESSREQLIYSEFFDFEKFVLEGNKILEEASMKFLKISPIDQRLLKIPYYRYYHRDEIIELLKEKISALDIYDDIQSARDNYLKAQRYNALLNSLSVYINLIYSDFDKVKQETDKYLKYIKAQLKFLKEYDNDIQDKKAYKAHKITVATDEVKSAKKRYVLCRDVSKIFAGGTIAAATYPLIEIFNGESASEFGLIMTCILGAITLVGGCITGFAIDDTISNYKTYKKAKENLKKLK